MRVLHVNDTGVHLGGAETNLFSIIELFQRKGHEHFLFAFQGNDEDSENVFILKDKSQSGKSRLEKVTFNLFDSEIYFNRLVYDALRRHIRRIDPDVIHLHNNFLHTNTVLFALRDSRRPVVQTAHDYGIICPTAWCVKKDKNLCDGGFGLRCLTEDCIWTKKFIREYLPRKLAWSLMKKTVRRFICPSKQIKERLERKGIENTVHIPYFVFPERFNSNPEGIVDFFVLFVGVLFPQKGVDYLLDAMPVVIRENPEATLHIVGDGPEKKKLELKAKKLGLLERVVFHGRVARDELAGFYNKANVVVVPSVWMEQFGIVGLEAMASGRPVVGSNIGGIPEWLSDGKTGFLTKPRNSQDLAKKINRILDDKKTAVNMGKLGQKIVMARYNADVVYPKLLEVYESAAK